MARKRNKINEIWKTTNKLGNKTKWRKKGRRRNEMEENITKGTNSLCTNHNNNSIEQITHSSTLVSATAAALTKWKDVQHKNVCKIICIDSKTFVYWSSIRFGNVVVYATQSFTLWNNISLPLYNAMLTTNSMVTIRMVIFRLCECAPKRDKSFSNYYMIISREKKHQENKWMSEINGKMK